MCTITKGVHPFWHQFTSFSQYGFSLSRITTNYFILHSIKRIEWLSLSCENVHSQKGNIWVEVYFFFLLFKKKFHKNRRTFINFEMGKIYTSNWSKVKSLIYRPLIDHPNLVSESSCGIQKFESDDRKNLDICNVKFNNRDSQNQKSIWISFLYYPTNP